MYVLLALFLLLNQDLQGYDFKSDIYSVGITAIQLVRGTVPYTGMAPTKVTCHKCCRSVY